MIKIKLLSPRVTAEASYTAGEIIEVENDEAFYLVEDRLGEPVDAKTKLAKPKRLIEAEKAAEEARKLEAEEAEQAKKTPAKAKK